IGNKCGKVIDYSSIYETQAWGKTDQGDFLNQAIMIETSLSAQALLKETLAIETFMGRSRTDKYAPRTIDIDILFFNHQVIDEPGLIIPHPEIQNRRFVLEPMKEIAPALIHPKLYKTILELLAECPDSLHVKKI
ncbi:MAG: 2-amino-4-hydroxy-6-hydroxymethyldihydropteridine diphosphokinase, partial [Flavitalea sp.]